MTQYQVFSTNNWLYETLYMNVQWEVYKSCRVWFCGHWDKQANCGPTVAQEHCEICQWSSLPTVLQDEISIDTD